MKRRRQSIVNQKFGRLLVIEELVDSKSQCKCKCDCGKITIKRASELTRTNRSTKSCGCLRKELSLEKVNTVLKDARFQVDGSKWIALRHYKTNARRRYLVWAITNDEFFDLVARPCHYCGALQTNTTKTNNPLRNNKFSYNGLDRINNNLGYTIGNILPCCFQCNKAKGDLSYTEFVRWLNKTYTHMENSNVV